MFPESPDCTLYDDTKRNCFWVTGGEPGVIEVLKVWKWPIVSFKILTHILTGHYNNAKQPMHWTDSRRGWAFLVILLLNYYFLFYFINKNNQCNVCKYKYYLTRHTHMSEVEVYSVNKLTFWAMDKNVVGKKISPPARSGLPKKRFNWHFKSPTNNGFRH